GRPPPEATLRWERGTGKEGAGDGGSQPVGRDGSFIVAGVPAWRPSHFVVMLPPPRRGRPLTPPQAEFDFVPSEGQGPGTRGRAEVTWRIPVYRWLVVRLDAATRFRIESPARAPYPQFLLERQEASGAWRARATDHFLSEAGGMAVSIAEPGRYRVIAAASPYLLYRTPEVEVADGDVEKAVELVFDGAAVPCELRVTDGGTGRPLGGAHVVASGERGSLPAVEGVTDSAGRFSLGPVRSATLELEVTAEGHAPRTVEAARSCMETGIIDVRL
ncbi:MAG TPA: carboxypeptidase-like regulatory domain-containing protein, partial [Polyangia bacterium]|nr:carboxypeptidase-like regulatory domain-containing protein [Polyangia bacterium]